MTLLGATVFMISGSTKLFEERYTLNGSWKDVAGLKEGATVRLAGWDVGEVIKIQFAEGAERRLDVKLSIELEYQGRIRKCSLQDEYPLDDSTPALQSSIARIDTVGVLGDKYVAITMGDPSCESLQNDSQIQTREALDIVQYTKKVTGILNNTDDISFKVNSILGTPADAEGASLSKSFKQLEDIIKEVQEGNGLIHALIYDQNLTAKVERSLDNLEESSIVLNSAMAEIQTGEGLAHELIYGSDGKKLAKQLLNVSIAVDGLLSDLKQSDSLINALIYDPEQKKILEDLAATASSMRLLGEDLRAGDGTAALLLRDPALYEDLRGLVGGAQRNKLLRSYLRKTIEENEKRLTSPFETNK